MSADENEDKRRANSTGTVYVQAFDVLKSEQHKEQEFVKQETISRELEANVLLRKIEDLQADVTLLEDTMKQLVA